MTGSETLLLAHLRRSLPWLGAAAFAASSLIVSKLALFALVGTLIAWAALPKRPARELRFERLLVAAAALCSIAASVRFAVTEAMPGIVQGGTSAAEQRAVSRLREILFAQDVLRKKGLHDPDGDGIGSAALLAELTGEDGVRGARRLAPPLLENYPKLVDTPIGPAAEIAGYLFLVCLPLPGGGFGADEGREIDEEAAERRFLAYAWPITQGAGRSAFFLDEHERILSADASFQPGHEKRSGHGHPPPCDDALAPATRAEWRPWRDKKPRRHLPGTRE
jgi:hypothetical protein